MLGQIFCSQCEKQQKAAYMLYSYAMCAHNERTLQWKSVCSTFELKTRTVHSMKCCKITRKWFVRCLSSPSNSLRTIAESCNYSHCLQYIIPHWQFHYRKCGFSWDEIKHTHPQSCVCIGDQNAWSSPWCIHRVVASKFSVPGCFWRKTWCIWLICTKMAKLI